MAKFGNQSIQHLLTCHADLKLILTESISIYDFSVLCGYRPKVEQERLFQECKTQVRYPDSKHNRTPSHAVDVAPYPINWKDKGRFMFLAGVINTVAYRLLEEGLITHKIRWGGDWNCNGNFKDQTFFDLPHFELIKA
ncbi:MAG: M15 family peptidase [Gammaproteobacteria bacterium]|nr:M15 family peptidase [Gammaproteobacteria bacterium]